MSCQNNSDQKFLSYALNLSRRNIGVTAPNPVVGCVIVKDGTIISTGVTAKNGRPHAEKIAIEKVTNKESLVGAEIYVTLEPCSHFGQTAPCVDEIIKYKFKRVVIAAIDCDKRVNGLGIAKLKEAGIEVTYETDLREAHEINRGFFKAKTLGMPFVTLKLATSFDGKIATNNFNSKWITCEKARIFSHNLRSKNDAILVGANTLRKDNPILNCRILGLEDFSPTRIVVSKNCNFDKELNFFSRHHSAAIVLTGNETKKTNNLNAKIINCAEKNGSVDLVDAMKKLAQNGINSVLVEGGQNIATQFMQEKLVDELVWIRSKKIIGNDGIAAIGNLNLQNIEEALDNFSRISLQELGSDVVEVLRSH